MTRRASKVHLDVSLYLVAAQSLLVYLSQPLYSDKSAASPHWGRAPPPDHPAARHVRYANWFPIIRANIQRVVGGIHVGGPLARRRWLYSRGE